MNFRSKTEGADKFWTSLEPYFSDITEADLHNLQTQDNVRKYIIHYKHIGGVSVNDDCLEF